MKRSSKLFLLSFLSMLIVFVSCNTDVESTDRKIDIAINNYVSKWDYKPGLCVAVYSPTLNLSYDFADGYFSLDSKEKITMFTPHILYSITKSFTASCIIKLINEGKLSYNDRVSDYLADLNQVYINTDATITELLSHRSGIYDYTDNAKLFYNNPFSNKGEWDPKKILNYLETPAMVRDKSTGKYSFKYSSANYILLGMIVEKITQKTLNEYMKENFLYPLDLSLSLLPEDVFDFSKLSHPHIYPNTSPLHLVGDGTTPIDVTTVIKDVIELSAKCSWAAGGIVGSANDTAKWGYELLSQRGKIDKKIRNTILDSVSEFDTVSREAEAYGYGIRKLFYNNKEFLGSYGRSVGDENLMFYNKDKDVCICILTNSNTRSDGNPNIDELMYAIYDCI